MKLLLATLIGSLVDTAHAASPYFGVYCNALGTYCGDGKLYVVHLATRTANVLIIPIVGGIGVIGILWASIKMTASFGDESGKEDAKKIITGSVVGIVLVVTGVALVNAACKAVELATNAGTSYCGW